MLSSASVHYVLEDCIKKSLIEIPAVRYTHTHKLHGKCTRAQVRGLPVCTPLLSSPVLFRSGRLDSHVPPVHDTSCNTSLSHYAPCESPTISPAFHQWQLMEVFVTVSSSGLHYTPQYFSLLLAKAHSFCFAASLCSGFAIFFFFYVYFQKVRLWKKRWDCFLCSLQPASSMTLKRKSP